MIPVDPYLFTAFTLVGFMSYYMLNRISELQQLNASEEITDSARLIEHIIIVLLFLNLVGAYWALAWPTVEAFFGQLKG